MNKLTLFDIDGTLVESIPNNPHAKAFTQTIENLYGIKTQLNWEGIAGLTDRLIFIDILEGVGWSREEILNKMPELIAELEAVYVNDFVPGSVKKMPGVDDVLQLLTANHITLGLLTGNLYEIAKAKLTDAGIFHYFELGGYGSDEHSQRSELVSIAAERAGLQDTLDSIYLVGDTPRDVSAARDARVFHAVGYSASHHGVESLTEAKAESVIQSFEDLESVKAALGLAT